VADGWDGDGEGGVGVWLFNCMERGFYQNPKNTPSLTIMPTLLEVFVLFAHSAPCLFSTAQRIK
jgi:hypothetical protein